MDNLSTQTINEIFISKLDSPDGLQKVAADGSAYVRTKLREVSFARKIVPPQFVTKEDLQRSVQHDGMVKIVDIEPDSEAVSINFRGSPNTRYLMGERYEIPFYTVSSKDFQKTEEELLAYDMPLYEIIEKNSVMDIQEIEDVNFISAVNTAITSSGKTTAGSYDGTTGEIPKASLKTLFDLLDGDRLNCDVILMDRKMYNRLFLYNATTVGNAVGSEVTVNGYTYSTLFGRKLVVSNKSDYTDGTDFLDNTIFAFTSPEFFANFYILNDTKFWIEKKKNIVTFAIYENIGFGIGNTKACASLTLS